MISAVSRPTQPIHHSVDRPTPERTATPETGLRRPVEQLSAQNGIEAHPDRRDRRAVRDTSQAIKHAEEKAKEASQDTEATHSSALTKRPPIAELRALDSARGRLIDTYA